MLLAKIDSAVYKSAVDTDKAVLDSDIAALDKTKADLEQKKAQRDQAQEDWKRAQEPGAGEKNADMRALADTQYDAYKYNYESTKAMVAVDEAAIKQAQATVAKDQAVLDGAQKNLDYCTINSPVDGVVIDRRVNIGQTVTSGLNTPSLFLIAKDLKRIEIWVSVNEADIANIYPGQPVTFTVDAYPGETFKGEVSKVRLNATMTQNVVTYTVEVVTDNPVGKLNPYQKGTPAGKLLPYLTANVQFELTRRTNVLLVPNAA